MALKHDFFQHKTREQSKSWCRKRGIEEQRFYEITKLRRQFEDLLKDCGLIEMMEKKDLTSAERAIRNGEMRQLKQLKRAHKLEVPKKKKLLQHDSYKIEKDEEEQDNEGKIDIRDVEFRMSHDSSRMHVSDIIILYELMPFKICFYFQRTYYLEQLLVGTET